MADGLRRASKFLSRVLRHNPGAIGISLDRGGWVAIDELLPAIQKAGVRLTRPQLEQLVADNAKQRFVIRNDRIRANQGHSINVDLGLAPVDPPDTLFHGTATRFLDAIMAEGLRKMSRQYVHLSTDVETASTVGIRHGVLAVLDVDAAAMKRDGHHFYLSENGVWLVDTVPPAYLRPHENDLVNR